jgi:hypothetical protein
MTSYIYLLTTELNCTEVSKHRTCSSRDIWGFHGGEDLHCGLLGYGAVHRGTHLTTQCHNPEHYNLNISLASLLERK